jgi:homoserine dehydrogenase
MSEKLFLGIVGLGTVGSGVIKSLELNSEIFKRKYGMEYEILGVSAAGKNTSRSIRIDRYPWFDDPLSIPDIEKINVIIELVGGEDGIAYDLSIKSLKKK